MQNGTAPVFNVGSQTSAYVNVTFPKKFAVIPTVVACADADESAGRIDVAVRYVTISGFKVYAFNMNEGTATVKANWIAVGK